MRDADWRQLVADFCVAHGVTGAMGVQRLRETDGYQLARRQYECGATDRVVKMLLVRALKEIT